MRRLLVAMLFGAACTPDALPVEATPGCTSDLDCVEPLGCRDGACVDIGDPCAPLLTCASSCIDPNSNPNHCGGCDDRCGDGLGCAGGLCCTEEAPFACQGECVDVRSDARHCGLCGAACAEGERCTNGSCCAAGLTWCDWACRDLRSDPLACGSCETPCPVGAACVDGACTACPDGTEAAQCGASQVCLDPSLPRDPCMALVPAGKFMMGLGSLTDEASFAPAHEVTLTHAYLLDVTEVSQATYQRCVDAGACIEPAISLLDRDPLLPAVYVSHAQAAQLCAFRGGRLPTEAEWERATRDLDQRCFPWGNEGCPPPENPPPPGCELATFVDCEGELTQVGRKRAGASAERILDLAGNAREWVSDWYAPYGADPVTDPTGPETGTEQIVRGGDFEHEAIEGAGMMRRTEFLDKWGASTGFRCAKDLP